MEKFYKKLQTIIDSPAEELVKSNLIQELKSVQSKGSIKSETGNHPQSENKEGERREVEKGTGIKPEEELLCDEVR